jgi:hypothetical protein
MHEETIMEPTEAERLRRLEEDNAKLKEDNAERKKREAPIELRRRNPGGPQRPADYVLSADYAFVPCAECGKPMVLNIENEKTERNRVYTPFESDKDNKLYIYVYDGAECTETLSGGPGCWQKSRGTDRPKYGGYPALGGKDKQANGRGEHEAYHRQQR